LVFVFQKMGSQNQNFLSALMTNINPSTANIASSLEKKTSLLGDVPDKSKGGGMGMGGGGGGKGGWGMGMGQGGGAGGGGGGGGGRGGMMQGNNNFGDFGSGFGVSRHSSLCVYG
jgi:hypothetical protein